MKRGILGLVALSLGVGCAEDDGSMMADAPEGTDTAGDDDDDSVGDDDDDSVGDDDDDDSGTVCERWRDVVQGQDEGSWSGAINSCSAGDMQGDWRPRTLDYLNFYRELAGMPTVSTDASRDAAAQACSLVLDANDDLSHSINNSWTCYSDDASLGASRSNIATTAAIAALKLYMVDPGAGNAGALGHRQWILSRQLGPVGIGSTDDYSCLWVTGGSGSASKEWVAWPSEGSFPIEEMATYWGAGIDDTGWSVHSQSFSLSGATIQVSAGGENKPVTTRTLDNGGSGGGVAFVPDGWSSEAGVTYRVEVGGIASPFSYEVTMVSCSN